MNELESLRTADPLAWSLAWQTSAFLAAGLAASFALRNRPARAHRALLLAMAAAVVAPILTEIGRGLGWGLWEAPAPAVAVAGPITVRGERPPARFDLPPPDVAVMAEDVASYGVREAGSPFPRRAVALAAWAVASGLLTLRLARTFAAARRLAGRAEVVEDASIRAELDAAREALGVAVASAVARSAEVRCPAIWCWSSPPRLLLPAAEGEGGGVDRAAIFRHELAHWRRRDHLSGLAAEALVCLLPWNPLAWASRARLGRLAELACDDWVVATGSSPEDYAETLLKLTPHRPAAALASVAGRGGLRGRVARILSDVRRDPVAGRRWTVVLGLLVAGVVAFVALARSRVGSEVHAATMEGTTMAKRVRGRVVGPDGRPMAGVQVRAVGERPSSIPARVGDQARRGPEALVVTGPVATDAEGRFEVPAPGGYDPEVGFGLLATGPGLGLSSRRVAPDAIDREHEIRIAPEARVEGRLLAPDGSPAADVHVRLDGFTDADSGDKGSALGSFYRERPAPDFWPKPARTDVDGRFTLVAPDGAYIMLTLDHPRYAVEDVTVDATGPEELPEAMKAFDIVPVPPRFTHTLRPARPVEGRVTDRETGEPAGDVLVTVFPMREHGGQGFPTRTDADGRYRVSGHFADHFYVTATPAKESGYLIASANRWEWPEGAEALTIDLKLTRGRRIVGRVIDADSGEPVAGASVAYAALGSNPNRDRAGASGPSVPTDAEGRFAVTGLTGEGFLAVETDDPGRMRGSWTPPGASANQEGRIVHAQGYATVVVPEEGEPEPVDVAVRRGVTIEARVVDPEGQPIDVESIYSGNNSISTHAQSRARRCPGGVFKIEGADPGRTYRVLFTNVGRELGGVAELRFEPGAAPAVVALRPTAVIRGRFVGPDGRPPARLPIVARALYEAGRPVVGEADLYDGDRSEFYVNLFGEAGINRHPMAPDADGRFRFDGLIPGVGLYVAAGEFRKPTMLPVWDLRPGEERDLGTMEVPAPGAR